ncbi:MAG: T9SS type A sorting domain-containing protein [Flavobacterium sp.]|uniref:T9SS-dependent choice-of-anchor J family protein n=1 Tax=Flavobacterium sp. TaxID=239 RepID=UPI00120EBCC5|nr:choice-of-anchor J domain-containing protein [Flavobacterium sp.]RZJ66537.1 MAG: T9SS type A sorting domain-containing protein [Flavobacterium sp.]
MKKIILSMLVAAAGLQANAQFQQNFDAATTLPTGWSAINQGDPNGWEVSASITGSAHSGANAARIVYGSVAHDDYLITPQIAVVTASTTRFSLWVKSRSTSFLEPYDVRLSTTTATAAAFTTVLQATQEAPVTWTKLEFDLSNYIGQSVYIAIHATGTNEFELYVDDAVSDSMPSCIAPTALTASNLSTSGATLGWTGTGNFVVEYGPTGFTQGNGTIIDALTNSSTIANLSANTTYQFYVRKNCGNGDLSTWAGPYSFTTPCAAVSAFNETFESTATATVMPSCWSKNIVSTDSGSYVYVSTSDVYAGTKALRMGNSGAATASLYAISPALNNVGAQTHRLRFWVKGSAGTTFQVGTMANPADATSFTSVQTITMTTTFQEFAVNFTAASTANFVAFKAAFTTTYGYVSIDNAVWEALPSCADVTGVATGIVTASSAIVNWDAVGQTYQYVIGATTVVDPFSLTAVDVATNSATIPVSPNSSYKVWVRNVCQGSVGAWSNPITFTTPCVAIAAANLPWTEGFEGVTTVGTNAFPGCWSEENGDWRTSVNATTAYDSDAHSGNNFVTNAWTATNEKLWTPGFELSANQPYEFSFWYASFQDSADEPYDDWDLSVLVNSAQNGTGSTVVGTPVVSAGQFAPTAYTKITRTFTPASTGVYYFGLNVSANGTPWYLSFDDFELKAGSLSTPDFSAKNISFYPNPVKDMFNLSSAENMTEASVYNVLGQQVIKKTINSNEAALDLSSLNAGTYIVKIATANGTKTIKIAKQ